MRRSGLRDTLPPCRQQQLRRAGLCGRSSSAPAPLIGRAHAWATDCHQGLAPPHSRQRHRNSDNRPRPHPHPRGSRTCDPRAITPQQERVMVRQRFSELARGLEPLTACLQANQHPRRDTRADLHRCCRPGGPSRPRAICVRYESTSTSTPVTAMGKAPKFTRVGGGGSVGASQ